MALMRGRAWAIGALALLAMVACSPSTSKAQPSATPSVSTLAGAKLVVANPSVRVGFGLNVKGTGFDPANKTLLSLVQAGKDYNLQVVQVNHDGSFATTVAIPNGLGAGAADLLACSYKAGKAQPVGCVKASIALAS